MKYRYPNLISEMKSQGISFNNIGTAIGKDIDSVKKALKLDHGITLAEAVAIRALFKNCSMLYLFQAGDFITTKDVPLMELFDQHDIIEQKAPEGMNMVDETLTLLEIAEKLHVSTRSLMKYIQEGRLKAVKIGGKWIVTETNYNSFVRGEHGKTEN
jgi:excisionase family DNA binding protein